MSLCQFFGFFHIIRAFHTYIVFIIISASRNGSLKYTCVTILNFHCNSIILSHYRISDYSRINFIYLFSLSRILILSSRYYHLLQGRRRSTEGIIAFLCTYPVFVPVSHLLLFFVNIYIWS